MTQYKIQVGSWTKLPDGKVQEDTRDIMEMMAEKVGGDVESHIARVGKYWNHVGITVEDQTVLVYDETYARWGLINEPSLFIPYEELQKMLKAPQAQNVPSLLNTKLDCRKSDGTIDEELSRAFQEACFEQGIVWAGGDSTSKTVQALSKNFLYSTECGLCYSAQLPTFEGSEERQINFKYSRTLTWEAAVVEPVTPEPVDEMVDGEAYMFEYNGNSGLIGILHSENRYGSLHRMLCMPKQDARYNSEFCTNIKRLV
tara:strand:+ start:31642 stop:32412 length:771 start_codon:yes stop_codon:yes gene_type:complete